MQRYIKLHYFTNITTSKLHYFTNSTASKLHYFTNFTPSKLQYDSVGAAKINASRK